MNNRPTTSVRQSTVNHLFEVLKRTFGVTLLGNRCYLLNVLNGLDKEDQDALKDLKATTDHCSILKKLNFIEAYDEVRGKGTRYRWMRNTAPTMEMAKEMAEALYERRAKAQQERSSKSSQDTQGEVAVPGQVLKMEDLPESTNRREYHIKGNLTREELDSAIRDFFIKVCNNVA